MGEIRPKRCEGRGLTKDQLEGLSAVPGSLPSIAGVTVSCRQTVLPWESDRQNVSMAR